MCVLMMLSGMLAVNSYNIRISSTQNYIPDEKRGRFNGLSAMIMTSGTLIGQVIFGGLGEVFTAKQIIPVAMLVNLVSVSIMIIGGKHVKQIYNKDL